MYLFDSSETERFLTFSTQVNEVMEQLSKQTNKGWRYVLVW